MPILKGTSGDDVLTGSSLTDILDSGWGDDVVEGGDGDDVIVDTGGSNILRGGGGNDIIRVSSYSGATAHDTLHPSSMIEAGDGDDEVQLETAAFQTFGIDLGSGSDLLVFSSKIPNFGCDFRVTTGAGSDRVVFTYQYGRTLGPDSAAVIIADFTAGAGGDVLDIGGLLKGRLAYQQKVAPNPFADGHLQLVQIGADVILRLDINGYVPGDSQTDLYDLVRLSNVSAASLTAYNFAGYAPDQSAPIRTTVTGTGAGEWLYAGNGGSSVFGQDGDDRITGGVSGDTIEGGAGNDRIDGGLGNDILRGGDGDDVLTDDFGNDTFEGGAGNDRISLLRPALLSGLPAISEQVTIDAGGGDDFVRFEPAFDEYGSGTDRRTVILKVDLGAGNDRIELPYLIADARLALGAGIDRVVFGEFYFRNRYKVDPKGLPPLVIADFTPGAGGDVLELDRALIGSAGWNGLTNPFASGHLRLQQSGADTLVIRDYDGNGPGTELYTVARLTGVSAASLTASNFGGYAPDGSASSYLVANGTSGDDLLYGSSGADLIDAGSGNDRIEERKGGSDTVFGGDGDDQILFSPSNASTHFDIVLIDAGAGNDIVDFLNAGARLTAYLGSGDDRLTLYYALAEGTAIALGAGADVIVLDGVLASQVRSMITIADFATGAGGDRLDWNSYAENKLINAQATYDRLFSVADYNPFLTGDARLVQSGANTLLQINLMAGSTAAPDYFTLITFQNASAAAFTPYNIGYQTYLPTLSGTPGNDLLNGGNGIDVILGEAGDDRIDGGIGDDVLRGLDGADTILGGEGRDRLDGGAGDDNLTGGGDSDYLNGGSGRDIVDGGAGDDDILDLLGTDTIIGGDGNDTINAFVSSFGPGGSVDAGNGNDFVRIEGNDPPPGYSVSLGAGDDVVRIVRPISSLSLGAGRDTVIYATPASIFGTLDLSDFAAGDAGDIFDLRTFLQNPLFNDGRLLLDLGNDPFALGYTALREVSGNVEMIVYPMGIPDDGHTPKIAVRFLNTTIAQLTAANFGGYDPHAVPNYGTIVDASRTVEAGQTLESVNATPYFYYSAHLIFQSLGGVGVPPAKPDFVNHGTILSRTTEAGYPTAAGIYVSPGKVPGGSFVNAADGRFIVRYEFAPAAGPSDGGYTFGLYSQGNSILFRNDGYFEVKAATGTAIGVQSGFDVSNLYPVINNGTFIVDSAYEALGIRMGHSGAFTNTGSITVSGQTFATGVWMSNYRTGQFDNRGDILVTTWAKSPYDSIGVYVDHDTGGLYAFSNSGSITADIAFYFADGNSDYNNNQDKLDNSGTIHGSIFTGFGIDTVLNRGTVAGSIFLGDGSDVYDGQSGTLNGAAFGEQGFDTLYGGAAGDYLDGGDDADRLSGFGGNDLLFGGAAADRIDGGDGDDRLQGDDGFDTLAGGSGMDWLIGGEGRDEVNGGEGDDRLQGDAGADQLTGGAGADVFAFQSIGDSVSYAPRSDGKKLMSDTIVDFTSGTDKIDLSAIDAVAGGGNNDAFTFIGSNTFSHHAGELRFEIHGSNALISADVDGDGLADLQIAAITSTLTVADFVL